MAYLNSRRRPSHCIILFIPQSITMRYLIVLILFIITSVSTEIIAQEITEFAGPWGRQYYQDDIRIDRLEAKSLILQHEESAELWKKWQQQSLVAGVTLIGTIGFAVWAQANDDANRSIAVPLIGAIATAGTSIGFGTAAFNSRKKAILTYNSQFDDRSVHLGPSNNGLGLTVAF